MKRYIPEDKFLEFLDNNKHRSTAYYKGPRDVILIDKLKTFLKKYGVELADCKELEHWKSITHGLWATDLPDKIPADVKKKYFWQLNYKGGENENVKI